MSDERSIVERAGSRPPRRRRWLIGGGVLVAVIAVAATATLAVVPHAEAEKPRTASARVDSATATITRGDLAVTTELDGGLGFGDATPIGSKATGTITELPAVGLALDRDTVIYRIDERPIVVFFGDVPLYRPLDAPNLSGRDVTMVAENLAALGLLRVRNAATVRTDAAFTAAVRAWQKRIGAPVTGAIAVGDVQTLPGASRVSSVAAHLGDAPGDAMMTVTGSTRIVSVEVQPALAAAMKTGDAVTVVLPDRREVAAHIASIGTVVSSDENQSDSGGTRLSVTVTLDDQAAVASLDAAPVKVRVTSDSRSGVLVAPIAALVALREGGYALQTPAGRLIAVTTGLFAGDSVEVSGAGITEGMRVVVAR